MKHLTTLRLIDEVARTGSIRKAAEDLALTPSALHRRIQAFEEELGERIFDRVPQGVRLNAAGELVIHHIRTQVAEFDRLKSRLADLSGMRRGHVSIACSQALTPHFLPTEIAAYRREFPHVTFDVLVLEHRAAEQALIDYTVDLALVFDTDRMSEFQVTTAVRQDLHAVMAEGHPLAAGETVRLRDCLRHRVILPTTSFGGRLLLQRALARTSLQLQPFMQSNSFEFMKRYLVHEQAVSFQIEIGAPAAAGQDGLVSRPVDPRDVGSGTLIFGQRHGRILPVASARFADRIARRLTTDYAPVEN